MPFKSAMSFNNGITAMTFNIMKKKNLYGTLKAFVSVFSMTHYSNSARENPSYFEMNRKPHPTSK